MVREFIEFSKKVLEAYETEAAIRMITTRFVNCVDYRRVTVERDEKINQYVKEYVKKNRVPWSIEEYTGKVTAIKLYPGKVVFHTVEWKK